MKKKYSRNKDLFSAGSFNVRGIVKEHDRELLCKDMEQYRVDICALQETKVKDYVDTNINMSNGEYRFISLSSQQKAYGMGFMISPKYKDLVHNYWKVADRLAVLQLKTDKSKVKVHAKEQHQITLLEGTTMKMKISKVQPADHIINIINVYAPHTGRLKKSMKELDKLYVQLSDLINNFENLSSSLTLVCGDFNAKVGLKSEEECMGPYTRGQRNNSGQMLIDHCEANNLFITNSAFKHSARHMTTWQQKRKINGEDITIFNMIDYILITNTKRQILVDSRSYAGMLKSSDHRLVVSRMEVKWPKMYKHKHKEISPKINTNMLHDPEARTKYQSKLKDITADQYSTWDLMKSKLLEAAEETVGKATYEKRSHRVHSQEVELLSKVQKELKLKVNATSGEESKMWKHERNICLKELKRNIKKDAEKQISGLIENIESAPNDAKMFKAVAELKKKPYENPVVKEDGKYVTNNQTRYNIINNHFQSKFFKPTAPKIERFSIKSKPLNKPIAAQEVKDAVKTMSNNRAADRSGITLNS